MNWKHYLENTIMNLETNINFARSLLISKLDYQLGNPRIMLNTKSRFQIDNYVSNLKNFIIIGDAFEFLDMFPTLQCSFEAMSDVSKLLFMSNFIIMFPS